MLRVLLNRLDLAETVRDDLLRGEEHRRALSTLELLDARFLHGLTQVLNNVLRGSLVALKEVSPGVLAANPTIIDRVFIVERVARGVLIHLQLELLGSLLFVTRLDYFDCAASLVPYSRLTLARIATASVSSRLQIKVESRAGSPFVHNLKVVSRLCLSCCDDRMLLLLPAMLVSFRAEGVVGEV